MIAIVVASMPAWAGVSHRTTPARSIRKRRWLKGKAHPARRASAMGSRQRVTLVFLVVLLHRELPDRLAEPFGADLHDAPGFH